MLWKMFQMKGLLNGDTANEINLVFDNCAGQNKNRMVYRMLFFMVKLKVCRVARAIFLIKGHTKNDCDRMFNLMKFDYRKVNCYSPIELIQIVNRHPQVTAVPMNPAEFKDWDTLENKMIDKMDGVKKNHIFTVDANDSNTMQIQEFAGAPVIRKLLVHKDFRDVDWRPLFDLQKLSPPGLPDIKWNELYSKWGQFVPQERKKELKYFLDKPPPTLKKAIAEQSAAARKARDMRTKSIRGVKVEKDKKTKKEPTRKKKAEPHDDDEKPVAKKRGRPKKNTNNIL
jgi:hypothetical protein